ncbi:DUF4129 domain-containing protein [Thermococcus pacificus]|uniref:Protein-glutamine gamma-glutamyltransferase-like C-terminal domain-containing protein n=1 Tax=Thermococcus pacificus TaxID=71998 RepID=A0A218P606_9EURY|nr:DUF4129 domain-containing protein [Thermococcus pacificus]ASJ06223.1 hypothetical protein A3L08_02205 [Thermococcus pacificus]
MSTRVKFAALYGLLFALMTLLLSYSVKTGEVKKSPAEFSGFLVIAVALLSAIVLALLFLSWRDIPLKRKLYPANNLKYLLSWIVMALGALGIIYWMKYSNASGLLTPVNNTTNVTVNGSVLPPSPVYHNNTLTNSTSPLSHTGYPLYIFLAVFMAGLAYFAVTYYREALKKRERKRMRKRALNFDRKVDELGFEMFSDPREAVVGIYKNAVLWLEVLGIPYRESWTHWEHAGKVNVSLLREPFTNLTRLFEKAKYAPEKVTWDDAERALELYRKMRGVLNEAP